MYSWVRRRKEKKQWDKISASSQARRQALAGQEADVDWLEELLFEADPIGINFEFNTDEYRPEAETVTLRRSEALSLEDVNRIIYEEFVRWFGEAGPRDLYEPIARKVWQRWSPADSTNQ